MTRTTDDLQDAERYSPLGAPIRKAKPEPAPSKPQGGSGIVTDPDGRMRTTTHPLPTEAVWPFGWFLP